MGLKVTVLTTRNPNNTVISSYASIWLNLAEKRFFPTIPIK
jgi:hypothetical protein